MDLCSLDLTLLDEIPDDASGAAWRARLSRAGLLRPVDVPEGGWSPQAGLAQVQRALGELEASEAALAEAQARHPLARVQLPPLVWGVVGAILLFLVLFAEVAVALAGPWAIWGGIGFAIAVATWTLLERKLVDPALRPRVKGARDALRGAVQALLDRDFVATLGPTVVLSAPSLDRLRGMAEALRSAAPDAPLLPRLDAAVAELQARVDALVAAAPRPWSDAGMAADLDRWLAEIDAG